MTNEELKKLYTSAEIALTTLQNDDINNYEPDEYKKMYSSALDIINKYKDKYYEILLIEKPIAEKLIKENEEAIEALKIIPEEEISSVSELNNLITENSKRLQNELSFNEDSFYEKYFISLPSKIKETPAQDAVYDERFIEWFGNSKVVNKDGKPLIVYHGSGGRIDEFTSFKFDIFPGNYFAENKSYSEWFSQIRGGNSFMFKCYLRVQNPIDLTEFKLDKVNYNDFVAYIKLKYGYDMPENKMLKAMSNATGGNWVWRYLKMGVDWLKFISKSKEFDGFHYYENNPDDIVNGKENVTKAWMVFHPNQIKAADNRNSTYSLFSKDIRMKKGGKL
jgi:hypothetical protein